MTQSVMIVGTGKRVLETAFPAFHRAEDAFTIRRVFARRPKTVTADGRDYTVEAFETLRQADLDGIDVVYMAVAKDAVPAVLTRWSELDRSSLELLIDTPVVRFKHFRHTRRLQGWKRVSVTEDCVELPWLEVVERVVASGALGDVRELVFDRSAYAYHGMATSKRVLGGRITRGRRIPRKGRDARRELTLTGGRTATIVEPRDYSVGTLLLRGTRGSIGDAPSDAAGHVQLEPVVEGGTWRGVRAGDVHTELGANEIELAQQDGGGSITARMEAMKRVGFLRLLRRVAAGDGAYDLTEALDDTVVDYYLEKLGTYLATPFTDVRSPVARAVLNAVTRAGG